PSFTTDTTAPAMFRFRNCDGISASRKVSKSGLVNSGAGLVFGATTETSAGGGDGADIKGDGAGPCALVTRIAIAVAMANAANCARAENARCIWHCTLPVLLNW